MTRLNKELFNYWKKYYPVSSILYKIIKYLWVVIVFASFIFLLFALDDGFLFIFLPIPFLIILVLLFFNEIILFQVYKNFYLYRIMRGIDLSNKANNFSEIKDNVDEPSDEDIDDHHKGINNIVDIADYAIQQLPLLLKKDLSFIERIPPIHINPTIGFNLLIKSTTIRPSTTDGKYDVTLKFKEQYDRYKLIDIIKVVEHEAVGAKPKIIYQKE